MKTVSIILSAAMPLFALALDDDAAQKMRDKSANPAERMRQEIVSAAELYASMVADGHVRKLDWLYITNTLIAAKSEMTTYEGRSMAERELEKSLDMALADGIIRGNLEGWSFRFDETAEDDTASIRGWTVARLNKDGLVTMRKDGASRMLNLEKLYCDYPFNLCDMMNHFIRNGNKNSSPKLRTILRAKGMAGSALFLRAVHRGDKTALRFADSFASDAVLVFPFGEIDKQVEDENVESVSKFAREKADEFVRRVVANSLAGRCGVGGGSSDRENGYVFSVCGYDTNKYERLLIDLAKEWMPSKNEGRAFSCEMAIRRIGEIGTTNSLPFLYECVTNPIVGGEAVRSAVRIDGIGSNTVASIGRYLALGSAKIGDRAMCCAGLFKQPCVTNAPAADRLNLADCLTGFASNACFCTRDIDVGIMSLDPSYRYSRRRLSVARAQLQLPLLEFGTNYVTSVISELVSYPESTLGD